MNGNLICTVLHLGTGGLGAHVVSSAGEVGEDVGAFWGSDVDGDGVRVEGDEAAGLGNLAGIEGGDEDLGADLDPASGDEGVVV